MRWFKRAYCSLTRGVAACFSLNSVFTVIVFTIERSVSNNFTIMQYISLNRVHTGCVQHNPPLSFRETFVWRCINGRLLGYDTFGLFAIASNAKEMLFVLRFSHDTHHRKVPQRHWEEKSFHLLHADDGQLCLQPQFPWDRQTDRQITHRWKSDFMCSQLLIISKLQAGMIQIFGFRIIPFL